MIINLIFTTLALYSIGPWSHLFRGTKEQNYVAHAMEMAACLGDYKDYDHCESGINSSLTFAAQKTTLYLFLVLNISFIFIKLINL